VATSSITIANYDNIPEFAVNFGDKDGDLRAHALAVDEFGYIYVHGISDSPAFGGSTSGVGSWNWVHAKTHWEMTYEVEFNTAVTGVTYSETHSLTGTAGYMGKRFKIPKKFKNTDAP
jgi:hypothetical protein